MRSYLDARFCQQVCDRQEAVSSESREFGGVSHWHGALTFRRSQEQDVNKIHEL